MKLKISSKKISTSVLISMTDVIFLLLLFLLIASNFSAQTGLPFKLPGSKSQQRQSQQILHLVYNGEGKINYRGADHTLKTLGAALKNDYSSPEQIVRLSAEQATPLQEVISVMDVIRQAGFEKIFVATEAIAD